MKDPGCDQQSEKQTMDEEQVDSRLDELWERGNAFIQDFRRELEGTRPKSRTARSIDRGDYWSETASWARRDGYDDFAREVDRRILEYNAIVADHGRLD
jgi:hypothetical protein